MPSEDREIEQRLDNFASDPQSHLEAECDSLMVQCLDVLASDALSRHWFCSKSSPLGTKAATFLIRLHAYDNDRVDKWKSNLIAVLRSCCECVKVYLEAKVKARSTYLSSYSRGALDRFFAGVDEWEAEMINQSIAQNGGSLDGLSTPVVYHVLASLTIFRREEISSLFSSPSIVFQRDDWPSEPPPGLLLLLLDENVQARLWARKQISSTTKILRLDSTSSLTPLFTAIVYRLASADMSDAQSNTKEDKSLTISMLPPASLWLEVPAVLDLLSYEAIRTGLVKLKDADFSALVMGHLPDVNPQFSGVLRCFIILLKAVGHELWRAEAPEYPQVVVDSIKDNPVFQQLVSSSSGDDWALSWFEDYLYTVWGEPIYGDALAKTFTFMGEELQHASYDVVRRASAFATLFKIILSSYRKARTEANDKVLQAARQTFEVHANVITDVSFAKGSASESWTAARQSARLLLRDVLEADANVIREAIRSVCQFRQANLTTSKVSTSIHPLPSLTIHAQLWRKSYDTLIKEHPQGAALLLRSVASVAYFDSLRAGESGAFTSLYVKPEAGPRLDSAIKSINSALYCVRGEFSKTIQHFAEYATQATVRNFMCQPDVVTNVMHLMLSPLSALNDAAKGLAINAYEDVGERSECFRALLQKYPASSFKGIISYLNTFNTYTSILPEACAAARSLVRCLTDVLEALCGKGDGLLMEGAFGQVDGLDLSIWLPKLWKHMAVALSIIFKRTQAWSRFYSNEEMLEWMRDALIFGRDMVDQVSVFQFVSSGAVRQDVMSSPRKLSRIESGLVEDLHAVLAELISWLKLTDQETLHQSFELLKSLLKHFADTSSSPPDDVIHILENHARRKKGTKTQLSDEKLSEMLIALSPFSKTSDSVLVSSMPVESADDDEIVYLGTSPKVPETKQTQSVVRERVADSSNKLKGYKQPDSKKQPDATGVLSSSAFQKHHHGRAIDAKIESYMTKATKKAASDVRGITSSHQKQLPATPRQTESSSKIDTVRPRLETNSEHVPRSHTRPSVPSSDEEVADEDSEEEAQGLASLVKQQKSPQKLKAPERRTVKRIDMVIRDPRQEQRHQQDVARRNLLRLKPDLSPLHRRILAWNYDHDGTEPPFSKTHPSSLIPVPDSFNSQNPHAEYSRVFEPLVLMEGWSQLAKSKDEDIPAFVCSISNRQFVDEWVDCDITVTEDVPAGWYLTDSDVVLLRQLGGTKCILAKVQTSKRSIRGIQASVRCNLSNDEMRPFDVLLVMHSKWQLRKVWSLSTIHREFAALLGLPYYDLFEDIVKGWPAPLPKAHPSKIKQAMSTYGLNEPQASAVLGAFEVKGFALIQGPPGTGKTSTILGLVSAFLSRRTRMATAVVPGETTHQASPLQKILICAPSNAAIDEVARRLKDGVAGPSGKLAFPKIVRIGPTESINSSVKDISLEALIIAKLSSDPVDSTEVSGDLALTRAELDSVRRRREERIAELGMLQDNTTRSDALQTEIKELSRKRMELTIRVDQMKDKQQSLNRALEANRRKFRLEVLSEADVICSTLSASGHEVLDSFEFETVVIDEAAQSIELSSLIPLKYRCRRCIMVGDPQQLPPTVLSQKASEYRYNQSLFVRIQKRRPDAVHLLSIQYRMHPEISILPSALFYNGRLLDGPGMAEKTAKPWHASRLFGPYRFFNVPEGQEQGAQNGFSLINRKEAVVALALYRRVIMEFGKAHPNIQIGVVTMYKAQMIELKRTFQQSEGISILNKVDFNTVDGFQGQEKDIIILSCVRAGPNVQSVGFLSDYRRMNVALTRSRSSLFVLGHAATLERSDPIWKQVVKDARERSCLFDVNVSTFEKLASNEASSKTPMKLPRPPISAMSSTSTPTFPLLTPQQLKAQRHSSRGQTAPNQTLSVPSNPSQKLNEHDLSSEPPNLSNKRKSMEDPERRTPPMLRKPPNVPNASDPDKAPKASGKNPAERKATTETASASTIPQKPTKQVSVFIPKPKPKKRPNPDDSIGTSDVKRRLTEGLYPKPKPK